MQIVSSAWRRLVLCTATKQIFTELSWSVKLFWCDAPYQPQELLHCIENNAFYNVFLPLEKLAGAD
jgi:hypothetical protein